MNSIVKFDPFEEIRALQRQFFGNDLLASPLKGLQIPTTDVYTEDEKQLTVEAHLPNFSQKDVDIRLEKGALIISAEKHEQETDKKKKYIVREGSSSFYRKIQLPERADESAITADMKNGVLKVVVPFTELPEPKRIAIGSGDKK